MRLYYIANARMPSEKAHGIQIAKMCEAFMDHGVDVTLVLPARNNRVRSLKEFYGLRQEIKTVMLPAFDLYDRGRAGYALSTFSFIVSYTLYALTHVKRGDSIYTVDLDHFSYAAIPFLRTPYFSEMHGGKPNTFVHRALFKRASGIIPTNTITRDQLKERFKIPDNKFIVEPNGVDFSKFAPVEMARAREELGLPRDIKLVLYIGRFFDWKGLGILSEAVRFLPKDITIGLVGGNSHEFTRVADQEPRGLVFYGDKPYTQMPLWEAAAHALLVLGTKKDEQSWQYTSPMKVFEYMAMRRPIVASRTPALQNILTDEDCYFYEPDSPESLAKVIESALASDGSRESRALEEVKKYSWDLRAKRILEFIQKHS